MRPTATRRRGRVLSWTRVHRAPEGFGTPFVLALIGFGDGDSVLAVGDAHPLLDEEVEVLEGVPPTFVRIARTTA